MNIYIFNLKIIYGLLGYLHITNYYIIYIYEIINIYCLINLRYYLFRGILFKIGSK